MCGGMDIAVVQMWLRIKCGLKMQLVIVGDKVETVVLSSPHFVSQTRFIPATSSPHPRFILYLRPASFPPQSCFIHASSPPHPRPFSAFASSLRPRWNDNMNINAVWVIHYTSWSCRQIDKQIGRQLNRLINKLTNRYMQIDRQEMSIGQQDHNS